MSFASLLLTLIAAALTMGFLLARSAHHLLNSSALSVGWRRRLHRSVRVSFTALLLGLLPPLVIIIANPPASGRDDPLLWVCAVGFYGGAGVALTGFAVLFGLSLWLSIRAGALVSLGAAIVGSVQWTLTAWQQSGHPQSARSHDFLWLDFPEEPPSAFSDYLGREQYTFDGRDETKLDALGLDSGPHRSGISRFSLDDQYDDE